MKIISFGDIHENTGNLAKMKDILETADIIIISGDLTNCHGPAHAQKVLDGIKKYNTHLYAQYGNMDLPEVNGLLTKEGINIHGNGYRIDSIGIFGCGGSSPTPFHTPSEIGEEEIERCLIQGYQMVKDAKRKVMVCHTPPVNTAIDKIRSGDHVGSKTVREFIVKYRPDVCISGHIHESRAKDKLDNTVLLNAGMFRDGWYIEVVIDENGLSAELRSIT